jgi:hypothetical protein
MTTISFQPKSLFYMYVYLCHSFSPFFKTLSRRIFSLNLFKNKNVWVSFKFSFSIYTLFIKQDFKTSNQNYIHSKLVFRKRSCYFVTVISIKLYIFVFVKCIFVLHASLSMSKASKDWKEALRSMPEIYKFVMLKIWIGLVMYLAQQGSSVTNFN